MNREVEHVAVVALRLVPREGDIRRRRRIERLVEGGDRPILNRPVAEQVHRDGGAPADRNLQTLGMKRRRRR